MQPKLARSSSLTRTRNPRWVDAFDPNRTRIDTGDITPIVTSISTFDASFEFARRCYFEDTLRVPLERIELWGYRCSSCGHGWVPANLEQRPDEKPTQPAEEPKSCPRCQSPYSGKTTSAQSRHKKALGTRTSLVLPVLKGRR